MITEPQDYFDKGCGRCARFDTADCSAQRWHQGLLALRRICRDEGLEETAKWGHPCYVHAGRNIALLGAFRGDFRINFMNAQLLEDRHQVLVKQGENSQVAGSISFTDHDAVGEMEPIIREYLQALKGFAEKGVKPQKTTPEVEMPEELVAALDADPELAEAFEALTPGRQRSYAIHLNAAKQSATRRNRIEKFRPKILAGKGALER